MTMADKIIGPEWLLWVIGALFLAESIALFTGHGTWFIAGYNTMSPKEKEKFDEKKLCRVVGSGFLFLAVVIFLIAIFMDKLSASMSFVLLALILADILTMLVLANLLCRKKK